MWSILESCGFPVGYSFSVPLEQACRGRRVREGICGSDVPPARWENKSLRPRTQPLVKQRATGEAWPRPRPARVRRLDSRTLPPPMQHKSNMNTQHNRSGSRRRGPRRRRPEEGSSFSSRPQQPAQKPSFFQKILGFFGFGPKKKAYPSYEGGRRSDSSRSHGSSEDRRSTGSGDSPAATPRPQRKPEAVEVTSPKLYVGNLSFDAGESDLSNLFNGVGVVRNAEVVTHRDTEKSKGFGFVTMSSVEEAMRAVAELHDKEFMGRRLVVSGAKTTDRIAA